MRINKQPNRLIKLDVQLVQKEELKHQRNNIYLKKEVDTVLKWRKGKKERTQAVDSPKIQDVRNETMKEQPNEKSLFKWQIQA